MSEMRRAEGASDGPGSAGALVAQVRRHLAEIPDLVVEASYYRTPGSAPMDPTFGGKSGKASVYKIPITSEIFDLLDDRDKALDDVMLNRSYGGFVTTKGIEAEADDFNINNAQRRLGVLPSLGLWVSLAFAELDDLGREPRECCPARNHTISGEASWLSDYAADIVELHDDFARDIELLWTELRKACRIRREYVPKCPQCRNRVEGVYGEVDDPAPAWWRCTGCGKSWVHAAEIARLASTQPRMTLRQIASLLQLPLRTLHHWRSQGRFSGDRSGRYELEHVRRAALSAGRNVDATA